MQHLKVSAVHAVERKKKESKTNLITRWKLKAAAGDNIDLTDIGKVEKKNFRFSFLVEFDLYSSSI